MFIYNSLLVELYLCSSMYIICLPFPYSISSPSFSSSSSSSSLSLSLSLRNQRCG